MALRTILSAGSGRPTRYSFSSLVARSGACLLSLLSLPSLALLAPAESHGRYGSSVLLASSSQGTPQTALRTDEEFVGPFASWMEVKRDFGAVGDGKADDTAAIQRALDALRPHDRSCVLYVPAGTYRITQTLTTVRKAHQDDMVTVVGEDPSKTIIRWDGPAGGTMFQWSAWYAKFSRITMDGAGKADVCLTYGPGFSTYNETSDLVCKDAKTGILVGKPDSQGQAENEVLRCRFVNCGTGVMTVNWNSMDVWVWYCTFQDCDRGIRNVMGNWHAWRNLFLRSKIADLSLQNLMVFSVVDNVSAGSKCFLDFSCGHTWGSPTSISGNRILDCTGDWAMILDNAGPYLVVDNAMRLGTATRGVRMTWGDQTLAGNIYTRPGAVEERGRFRRIAERVVAAKEIADQMPVMPPTPPRRERHVFDLPATADAAAIQRAIEQAARVSGRRPVVHLPMGAYKIDRTLVIPASCDLQLVGDGASEVATRLVWSGPAGGPVLKIEGPSHAVVRDLQIQGGRAQAVLVEMPDTAQSRFFADQLNTSGPTGGRKDADPTKGSALTVQGFDKASIQFRALQGSGNDGSWVEVLGTGGETNSGPAVGVFTGATGSAMGQYDVRQGGRLVVRGVYHEKSADSLNGLHLTDSGTISIDATRFSYATSTAAATVAADSFRGLFTMATSMLLPVDSQETCRFEIRGDGSRASVLSLDNLFWVQKPPISADIVWLNRASPAAHGGLVGCNINTGNKQASPRGFEFLNNVGDNPDPARPKYGSGPLADRGSVDDATILRHLAPLRATHAFDPAMLPAVQSDIRLYRVIATGCGSVVEIKAK